MAILLDNGKNTEFMYNKENDGVNYSYHCPNESAGSTTYWKGPVIHSRPKRDDTTRKLILITFDFVTFASIHRLEAYYEKLPGYNEYIRKFIYMKRYEINNMTLDEKKHEEAKYEQFVKNEIKALYGFKDKDEYDKVENNFRNGMGGGNKHKYKGRWYSIRTGTRGGKYIVVNKEKVYVS